MYFTKYNFWSMAAIYMRFLAGQSHPARYSGEMLCDHADISQARIRRDHLATRLWATSDCFGLIASIVSCRLIYVG